MFISIFYLYVFYCVFEVLFLSEIGFFVLVFLIFIEIFIRMIVIVVNIFMVNKIVFWFKFYLIKKEIIVFLKFVEVINKFVILLMYFWIMIDVSVKVMGNMFVIFRLIKNVLFNWSIGLFI